MKLNTKKQLTALYFVVSFFLLFGQLDTDNSTALWGYTIIVLLNLANAARLMNKLEKHLHDYGNVSNSNRVSQRTN